VVHGLQRSHEKSGILVFRNVKLYENKNNTVSTRGHDKHHTFPTALKIATLVQDHERNVEMFSHKNYPHKMSCH